MDFEIAAHPRAHLDRLTRFELAGEVAPFLHIPDQRLSHRDGRRRRRCLCRLVSFPEAPIMIEKRGGRTHREKQKDAFYGSPATRRRGHGSCRRLGLARRRIAGLQVRSRLRCIFFGFAIAGFIVPVTTSVAVTVSLFHPRRIRYRAREKFAPNQHYKTLLPGRYPKAACQREWQRPNKHPTKTARSAGILPPWSRQFAVPPFVQVGAGESLSSGTWFVRLRVS